MDDGLDDLFGDDVPILPAPAPTDPALSRRLGELSRSGCAQKIAWSRLGVIASVCQNGTSLQLHHLHRPPSHGRWQLSKATMVKDTHLELFVQRGAEIGHISWSPTGHTLAIADTLGHLFFLRIQLVLNSAHIVQRQTDQVDDSLMAIVGLAWLESENQIPRYLPAAKRGDEKWEYPVIGHKPLGPLHPGQGSSAMASVTRNGALRLFYQGGNAIKWPEIKGELESISSSGDLITHAAFAGEPDGSLLLAAHTSRGQLRLYKLHVDFKQSRLHVQHMQIIEDCLTLDLVGSLASEDPLSYTPQTSSAGCLYLLTVLPADQTSRNGPSVPPEILAVCHREPNSSVISRWQSGLVSSELHPVFATLASKAAGNQENLKSATRFFPKARKTFDKTITSAFPQAFGSVLCFVFSDGSSTFCDRTNLEPLPEDDSAQAHGLIQAGFRFPNLSDALHLGLSPNECAIVSLGQDDVPHLHTLLRSSDNGLETDHVGAALTRAMLAGMTRLSCTAPFDDLLATTQAFLNEHGAKIEAYEQGTGYSVRQMMVSGAYAALKALPGDLSKTEKDQSLRNITTRQCLSLQLALYKGDNTRRQPLPAKVSETVLKLRVTALLFVSIWENILNPPLFRAVHDRLTWSRGLVNFLVDELFTLADWWSTSDTRDPASVLAKVKEIGSPALPLLLLSSTRFSIRRCCETIIYLDQKCKEEPKQPKTPSTHEHLQEIKFLLQDPVPMSDFWKMLREFESDVEKCYETAALSQEQRDARERDIVLWTKIPDLLMPAIATLLETRVEQVRSGIAHEAELYFLDLYPLDLINDAKSVVWNRHHILDGIQHGLLDQDTEIRRCIRCGAVTENKSANHNAYPWLFQVQRTCYCGGWWAIDYDMAKEIMQTESH